MDKNVKRNIGALAVSINEVLVSWVLAVHYRLDHIMTDVSMLGKILQCFDGIGKHFKSGNHAYGGLNSQVCPALLCQSDPVLSLWSFSSYLSEHMFLSESSA